MKKVESQDFELVDALHGMHVEEVQSLSVDLYDDKLSYSPRFQHSGSQSARELRVSSKEKILALILFHNDISCAIAKRRYCDPNGYNVRVAVVPVIQPHEYIRPNDTVFENPEETLLRVTELLNSAGSENIPNVLLVEANYSMPGCIIPNFALFRALMKEYPSAKMVLHSMTPECIKAACHEFRGNHDVVCLIRDEQVMNTFAEEKDLISRAKNMGRRNTITF